MDSAGQHSTGGGGATAQSSRRRVRRIIAEDSEWSLATVPSLRSVVLRAIVRDFARNPLLPELNAVDQAFVLRYLPLDLPVEVTAPLITDDAYWRRCCRCRWPAGDVSGHGGDHKRMYMERHAAESLQVHLPQAAADIGDFGRLRELLRVCAEHVRALDVRQLLPPVLNAGGEQRREQQQQRRRKKHARADVVALGAASAGKAAVTPGPEQTEASGSDDDDDDELGMDEEGRCDHLDMSGALKCLPELRRLSVVYQVRNVGMNFDFSLFRFTRRDCKALAVGVVGCAHLAELHVTKSGLDDDHARLLAKYLKLHATLHTLDLSFNRIGDQGAKALARLLAPDSMPPLTTLDLSDNCLGEDGGVAVGAVLARNARLVTLRLRLNRLGAGGSQAVVQALKSNKHLEELGLSACGVAGSAALTLREVLDRNRTVRRIDLSCNRLDGEFGKLVLEGLTGNSTITELDLRLCDVGQENEYQINQILKKNMEDQGMMPKM